MTSHEYDFLTGKWQGPKGGAYNQVYEFCKDRGWCNLLGSVTESGKAAVRRYQENENYLRIDVI